MAGPDLRAATGLLPLLLAGAAAAAPSQLDVMPTADVVPPRQIAVQVQNGNTDWSGDGSFLRRPEPAFQTQLGVLSQRIEAGLDLVTLDSPTDYRPILNVKVDPLLEGYTWPAIGLGIAQVGPGFDRQVYVVASRTLNYQQIQYQKFRAHHRNRKLRGIRIHAGVLETSDLGHAMVGSDVEISDHFVVYADWVSGQDHAATLGGVWVLDQKSSVQVALFLGNQDHRIDGIQIGPSRQFGW